MATLPVEQRHLVYEKLKFGGVEVDKLNALHLFQDFFGEGAMLAPTIRIVKDTDSVMAYDPFNKEWLISESCPQRIGIEYLKHFQDKTGFTLPLEEKLVKTISSGKLDGDPSRRANFKLQETENLKIASQVVKQPLFESYFKAVKQKVENMEGKEKEIFIKKRLDGYMRVCEHAIRTLITAACVHEYKHYMDNDKAVSKIAVITGIVGLTAPFVSLAFQPEMHALISMIDPSASINMGWEFWLTYFAVSPTIGFSLMRKLQYRLRYVNEIGAYRKQVEYIKSGKPPVVKIPSREKFWAPCFSDLGFLASLQLDK